MFVLNYSILLTKKLIKCFCELVYAIYTKNNTSYTFSVFLF